MCYAVETYKFLVFPSEIFYWNLSAGKKRFSGQKSPPGKGLPFPSEKIKISGYFPVENTFLIQTLYYFRKALE